MIGLSQPRCRLYFALLIATPLALGSAKSIAANEAEKNVVAASPARGIERDHNAPRDRDAHGFPQADRRSVRSIDGSGNNLRRPEYNATQTQLRRLLPSAYSDAISQLGGAGNSDPRSISNAMAAQTLPSNNHLGLSDYLWQWGQFLDHDIDLTGGTFPIEPANLPIPVGDPHFDPASAGDKVMQFNRSAYDTETGTSPENPRQQINEITGWIDASNVYGSDAERAHELRRNDGTGRMKTSAGSLLPFNTAGLPNAGGSGDTLFLAGDVRANEQVGLTAMHTLFVREHNRLAQKIARRNPFLSGDEIYESARRLVAVEIQAITFEEFIPALLGPDVLSPYRGYDRSVDARIMNEFSTGAFRLGHSLLNAKILRVDRRGNEISAGHLPLRNAFFTPREIIDHGIEPILRGLAKQHCQDLDVFIIDDVRNFLFGPPGNGGFDLASLNIQRGRDHGLPTYNDAREGLGLPRAATFADVSSDPNVQQRLAAAYANPDQIDFWVGGLSEDHVPAAMVGELFLQVLASQFEALRDGDRFWYKATLTRADRRLIGSMRLSSIILRNTRVGRELPRDVFRISR